MHSGALPSALDRERCWLRRVTPGVARSAALPRKLGIVRVAAKPCCTTGASAAATLVVPAEPPGGAGSLERQRSGSGTGCTWHIAMAAQLPTHAPKLTAQGRCCGGAVVAPTHGVLHSTELQQPGGQTGPWLQVPGRTTGHGARPRGQGPPLSALAVLTWLKPRQLSCPSSAQQPSPSTLCQPFPLRPTCPHSPSAPASKLSSLSAYHLHRRPLVPVRRPGCRTTRAPR